jgi:hypothetical protein
MMFSYPLKEKEIWGGNLSKSEWGDGKNCAQGKFALARDIGEQPADILRVIYFSSSLG